jgi:hypothetical protein
VKRRDMKLLTESLDGLLADTRRVLDSSNLHDPVLGSRAAQELSSLPDKELMKVAYSQADQLLQVTAEHVVGFIRALAEPALTIAPWVSVRAVIESSALASWLLDTDIDPKLRVTRSLALRFEGLSQQLKFARATENQVSIKKAQDRIDTVVTEATGAGFVVTRDDKGRVTSIGQAMLSFTDLAKVFDEESTYRLCSAITHAHSWALQQLSFQVEEGKADNESDTDPVYFLRKAVNPIGLGYLSLKAAEGFARPLLYKARLFGWNVNSLEASFRTRFDELEKMAKGFVVQRRIERGSTG